jgi:hypothetical protein
MVPGNVWVLLGESGGRARGCSAFHVPITWSMPTWEGTKLAPANSRNSRRAPDLAARGYLTYLLVVLRA